MAYFFLLTADSQDLLLASPGNPEHLSRVHVVGGGTLTGDERTAIVRYLDSPSTNPDADPYVVLWTFNDAEGWSRSPVYLVP